AQAVAAPAVVNGRLEKPGDVDVFSVAVKKGETLIASVDAYRSLRSPMDAVLQVLSADGFVLDQNNDWHGLDPQVAFTAPKDGTYLVRLFAFPAVPDASIRLAGAETFVYRLTLTTGGFADYAAPLAVERKPDARVTVHGWNIPAEAQTLPVTAAGDRATVFHPRLANVLRVRIEDHPCWDADRNRPTGPLQPPFSVTGRLERPGATGTVTVAAKKGQPLHVRAESRDLGLPVNPVVRVLDGAGKQLARAEPPKINTDVELAFNPPADGTYKVEVEDLHASGGPRFVYRLRVTPPEPGFNLTVTNDRFALDPAKPLDIPVTVARRDGFTGEVEVAAEGLPAGVSAAVVPPPGKGEAKTVTLRLTGDTPGPPGPFRIVGRAKGQPGIAHAARAPVLEFDSTTPDLWLAVGGKVPPPPKKNR
ncbi:MAG: PPC domain-containing protein, partial [Zavarzinella sp.]|nr:PPC domain-containing protein [Zavarzinella sp.]